MAKKILKWKDYRFVYSNSTDWVDYPDGHPGTEVTPPYCAAVMQILRNGKVISEDQYIAPGCWVRTDQDNYLDKAIEARQKA